MNQKTNVKWVHVVLLSSLLSIGQSAQAGREEVIIAYARLAKEKACSSIGAFVAATAIACGITLWAFSVQKKVNDLEKKVSAVSVGQQGVNLQESLLFKRINENERLLKMLQGDQEALKRYQEELYLDQDIRNYSQIDFNTGVSLLKDALEKRVSGLEKTVNVGVKNVPGTTDLEVLYKKVEALSSRVDGIESELDGDIEPVESKPRKLLFQS